MKKNISNNFGLVDLSQPRLGTKVIYKTDDFFGDVNRIINLNKPIWKDGVYDQNGKWMDGWETRRKRTKGNDYLILKFGKPGVIKKVDVDTSYFLEIILIKFHYMHVLVKKKYMIKKLNG